MANQATMNGCPMPVLQKVLGHSSLAVTSTYCMVSERQVIESMQGW